MRGARPTAPLSKGRTPSMKSPASSPIPEIDTGIQPNRSTSSFFAVIGLLLLSVISLVIISLQDTSADL